MTELEHHQAFIASHAAQLHQIARDTWRDYGPGYILVHCGRGEHTIGYLRQRHHQQNVANRDCSEEVAEVAGGLLAQYTDPETMFPVVMEHDDGTITGLMVRAVAAA